MQGTEMRASTVNDRYAFSLVSLHNLLPFVVFSRRSLTDCYGAS